MITAAAYVLLVPPDRRRILLAPDRSYFTEEPAIAEPVPRFAHSSRAPLIVFCCFEKNAITHIADGRKGASAGTRQLPPPRCEPGAGRVIRYSKVLTSRSSAT